jgi:acylphosphatase
MKKTVHIFFSGRVQGVGFRFTARAVANRYKIDGWVKNTHDSRVEIIAQGRKKDIDNFVDDLKQEFSGHVLDVDIEQIESSDDYDSFQIKLGAL